MSELDDLKVIVEANQQYNLTEHTEIHEAIDFERIQRIAGDAVVLGQLDTVNTRVTTVSSALGNEVIARTLGDQVSDGLYQGLSARFILEWQDLTSQLSDLSIDVVNNANQLQGAINTVAMSVEVLATNLRQEAQDLFTQYDDRLEELDQRVAKYEIMLQDITMDSSQITMDNGEITLGAWTILSQAREWDLEIIRKMDKYQLNTTEDINQALDDIQSQLPNAGEIINQAIEALSNAPIIKDLDSKLTGAIGDINDLNQGLLGEITNRQNEMIAQAQNTANALKVQADELIANILAETTARIDAVTREADIRALQIEGINSSISEETAVRIEEIRLLNDGLTAEVNSRVEGDQNITTSLDNYKESNDTALANVRNTVEVLVSDSTAMSQTVSSLDARLTVTETNTATANSLAASANEKATTALTATTSLAERMESVEASIETVQGDLTNKVDVVAFNSLKTEVTAIDGRVTTNTANIASITNNITDISSQLTANTTAISELSTKQTQQDNDIEQVSSQITQLSADIDSVQNAVANKADASAVASLTTQVNQQGEDITLINSDVTTLKGSVSTIEGNLASKADVTAFNALDSKVTTVDGKVTALNSNVISLESRIITAEAGLATKADASALNDIYTKSESDNAIAGQITSFKAGLVIGGVNVLLNSKEPRSGVNEYLMYEASVELKNFYDQHLNKDVTISCEIYVPVAGNVQIYTSNSSAHNFSFGTPIPANQWTRVVATVKPIPHDTNPDWHTSSLEFYGEYGTGRIVTVRNVQLEAGNVATSWSPSPRDIQGAIDANASAIQTVNAEVARVNGEVVSTANSVSNLSSNVGLLQGSINEVRQTVTNNQESTNTLVTSLRSGMADADDVSMMMRSATVVFEDLNFHDGYNDVSAYNNHYNGALALNFTDKLPDNPVASTRQIELIHSGGATTPGLGGFVQSVQSRSNGVFLVKFVAKLPVGFSFSLAANAHGDGADDYFIGSSEGTGKFKTYYGVYRCGATGSFSTVGFVYVQGSHPTPENPLIWYLASSTMYDCLDSKVAPDSVVNGIAEAKNIASTAVNKSEAISNQITDLSATLDMSVLPSKRDTTKANQWLLTHVVPKAAGWVSQGVYPDFSVLKTGIKNKRIYCADGSTYLSGSEYDNTVLYFRTIVYVYEDIVVNLGSFIGDDAHSIYVNGVLNFTKGYYGSTDNLRLALKQGLNTVDVICYNGGGLAGFSSSVLLSSLVVNMYAPESVEEQAAATANAVSSLTATVSDIDGKVTTQASSITQLQADVSGNSSKLIVQGDVVNGLKASYVVKTDVNGLVAGYGLYNTGSTSAFGVNADYFYVGKSDAGGKKPFMVLNTPQTIGGVTYPAGTWIDVALIANATIGSAHIANASITDAHIVSLNASKITAGIIDAERIGANSISVEKLMVGDATNLWGNQHFKPNAPLLYSSQNRTSITYDVYELRGNGLRMWGRDHIAPVSTNIPLKVGDTFIIEFVGGFNGGTPHDLGVGLWVTDAHGNVGTAPWQYGGMEVIASLGSGWYRYRRTFQIVSNGAPLPAAYGRLYFQIEQGEGEAEPAYWTVGDVTVRKGVGGELIVNGSVTADKIQVDSLSAISATLGTLVSLEDASNPNGARTVMTGAKSEVYDSAGRLVMRWGRW